MNATLDLDDGVGAEDEGVGCEDTERAAREALAELELLNRLSPRRSIDRTTMAAVSAVRSGDEQTSVAVAESTGSGLSTLFGKPRRLYIHQPEVVRSPESVDDRSLPTLSEEHDEDDECGQDNERGPESPTCVEVSDASRGSDDVRSEIDDDSAFSTMLRCLREDSGALALGVEDLTTIKLERVRGALELQQQQQLYLDRERQNNDDTGCSAPLVDEMARVRTMLAVDTLALLVERCGSRDVQRAVQTAVRSTFDSLATTSGVSMLSKAATVVTALNIARVVLVARRELGAAPTSNSSNIRIAPLSVTSPRSSVQKVSTPRSSSSRSIAPPSSPSRRSILAMDGVQVLMQEKLSAFEHRGPTGALPCFKVRRDGPLAIDAAAQRRQRALEYAASRSHLRDGSNAAPPPR